MTCKGFMSMYNVRGIQKYVFGSNKLKEIVGASNLIEKKIRLLLEEAMVTVCGEGASVLKKDIYDEIDASQPKKAKNWKFEDEEVKAEIVYQGGGNIVVLFKDEEQLKEVNRIFGTSLIITMRGLVSVNAYVPITGIYNKDQKELRDKLRKVEESMPPLFEMGNLPITMEDGVTGEPLSTEVKVNNVWRKVSKGRYQKLMAFNDLKKENDITDYKFLEDGLVAVVHLDGNNMGIDIANATANIEDYNEGIKKIREISENVSFYYEKAFEDSKKEMGFDQKVRKIILAGDDVCYICDSEGALSFTEQFIKNIEKYRMIETDSNTQFRACAGLVYVNAHYPFSTAYELAEELCSSAKAEAKKEVNRINGKAQSYVDFHLCRSTIYTDIKEVREKEYRNIEGLSLTRKPYRISENSNTSTSSHINEFWDSLSDLSNDQFARNKKKLLRGAYYDSEAELKLTVEAINSRNLVLEKELYKNGKAYYFDALELEDLELPKGGRI